jgi:hypothetical protein
VITKRASGGGTLPYRQTESTVGDDGIGFILQAGGNGEKQDVAEQPFRTLILSLG